MWEKILIKLLPLLITVLTPSLKEVVCVFVDEFEKKAKETANPWDDFAASILRELLCPKQK